MKFKGLLIVLCMMVLAGCQTQQQRLQTEEAQRLQEAERWITEMATVMAFDQEQAEAAFRTFEKPLEQPFELYRYGLVNQQLADRLGWIRARDSFRSLSFYPLSSELQTLVTFLQKHNQRMINADERNSRLIQAISQNDAEQKRLTEELADSQQALDKLQQQLEALKAVETAISHKRDAPLPVEK